MTVHLIHAWVRRLRGPPGSVPYATGRVENALRFSTLHPVPASREIGRRLWGA